MVGHVPLELGQRGRRVGAVEPADRHDRLTAGQLQRRGAVRAHRGRGPPVAGRAVLEQRGQGAADRVLPPRPPPRPPNPPRPPPGKPPPEAPRTPAGRPAGPRARRARCPVLPPNPPPRPGRAAGPAGAAQCRRCRRTAGPAEARRRGRARRPDRSGQARRPHRGRRTRSPPGPRSAARRRAASRPCPGCRRRARRARRRGPGTPGAARSATLPHAGAARPTTATARRAGARPRPARRAGRPRAATDTRPGSGPAAHTTSSAVTTTPAASQPRPNQLRSWNRQPSRTRHSWTAPMPTRAPIAGRERDGVVGVDDARHVAEHRAGDQQPPAPQQGRGPGPVGARLAPGAPQQRRERDQRGRDQPADLAAHVSSEQPGQPGRAAGRGDRRGRPAPPTAPFSLPSSRPNPL